jgi:hypothetical protein
MFIFDSNGDWRPIIRNSKLFEYADEAVRDADFITIPGEAGDQVYLTGVGVQVFDGANWVTLLSKTKTAIIPAFGDLGLLPSPEVGTTVWVKNADGNNNPSLFIYDDTSTWVPINKDFDTENEKLIVISDDANRDTQFPSPVAGDQFFNVDLNSIDVYDGLKWISASNSTEIVLNIAALPSVPTPETGTTIWVEDADGNNNPSLFIFDNANNWVPVNNKRIIVDVTANRATQFPSPVTGDQFFNLDLNSIDVYDGTGWIEQSSISIAKTESFDNVASITASLAELGVMVLVRNYLIDTIPTPTLLIYDGTDWIPAANYLEADNGLTIDPTNGKIEIGGALNKATSIETSSTETLAIEGLIDSIDPADKFLVVDGAGVMRSRDPSTFFGVNYLERYGTNEITINDATGTGPILFDTPGIADPANYTSSDEEITVLHDGEYVVSYRVTSTTTTYIDPISIDFAAFKAPTSAGTPVIIPGSVSSSTYKADGDRVTVTAIRIVSLEAGNSISVGANVVPSSSTSVVKTVPNGFSLIIGRIK